MEAVRKLQPDASATPRAQGVAMRQRDTGVITGRYQAIGDPAGPFVGLRDFTVMLVDDEPVTLEVIQTYLEEAGYKNFIATSRPVEAVDLLRERRPDILLLDLMMPEVSGFDILAQVRAEESLR